jgi:hypothetical protein
MSAETTLVQRTVKDRRQESTNMLRSILYGDGKPRPPLTICRWVDDSTAAGGEAPPSAACNPDRLDVAVHAEEGVVLDVALLTKWFEGQVDRLHICRGCQPDVVISVPRSGNPKSEARSIYGLGVLFLGLARKDEKVLEVQTGYLQALDEFQGLIGTPFFLIPEASSLVELSPGNVLMPFTLNTVVLTIIALWLALRAHRKVLEYFSNNGVLLPLAAATGKRNFYSAVWLLTALRVMCFLGAAIPMCYVGLKDISGPDSFAELKPHRELIVVWLVVLVSTIGFLTTLSSVADLKHRTSFFSILYRYVPFLLAVVGALLWSGSFLLATDASGDFRLVLASIPVIGLMPLMLAPILQLPMSVLVVHGVLSLVGLFAVVRVNSTWFAAHLEEV